MSQTCSSAVLRLHLAEFAPNEHMIMRVRINSYTTSMRGTTLIRQMLPLCSPYFMLRIILFYEIKQKRQFNSSTSAEPCTHSYKSSAIGSAHTAGGHSPFATHLPAAEARRSQLRMSCSPRAVCLLPTFKPTAIAVLCTPSFLLPPPAYAHQHICRSNFLLP